jgi:predicted peptidase
LHGAGQRGNDNESQLKWGVFDIIEQSLKLGEDPIVFIPQCPEDFRWVEVHWGDSSHSMPKNPSKPLGAVMKMIDSLIIELPIDSNRIYLTGMSMGGFGTWDLMMREPNLFAAAVPVCGGADNSKLVTIKHIPLWVFHGNDDTVVLPERSQIDVRRLKELGADVIYTEFSEVGHNSWTPAYSQKELYQWLFKQRK